MIIQKIPAQVYAEGYIRAYARLLQLSVSELIASFRSLNVYSDNSVPVKLEEKDEGGSRINATELLKNRRNQFILASSFLVLVALAIFGMKSKLFNISKVDMPDVSGVANEMVEDKLKEVFEEKEEQGVPVFTINVADDVTEFGRENND